MNWLENAQTRIAMCWRIERRDGIALGLTGHDRDLFIDGIVYRSAPGMVPSAVTRGASLDAESMDVTGALHDDAITEADLLAGRWDGARVTLFATDWSDTAQQVTLGDGWIGAVDVVGTQITAELKNIAAALERPVVEETSPECRAQLGDKRCRASMATRRKYAEVLTVEGNVLTLDQAESSANQYGNGSLCWLDGANSGMEAMIAKSNGAQIILRRPPHHAEGGRVLMTEGCDKSIATCATRFSNAVNFRGEPYLPGSDLLTYYP